MNISSILIVCILVIFTNAQNSTKAKRSWVDPWFLPPPYALRPHLRSGLSTWWAAPWTDHIPLIHEPIVHDHHDHHDHHHHIIDPPPLAPISLPSIPFEHGHHHGHAAKYVAANLGSIHIAPLLGHTEDVFSTNLEPAPGRPWL